MLAFPYHYRHHHYHYSSNASSWWKLLNAFPSASSCAPIEYAVITYCHAYKWVVLPSFRINPRGLSNVSLKKQRPPPDISLRFAVMLGWSRCCTYGGLGGSSPQSTGMQAPRRLVSSQLRPTLGNVTCNGSFSIDSLIRFGFKDTRIKIFAGISSRSNVGYFLVLFTFSVSKPSSWVVGDKNTAKTKCIEIY